MSDPRVLDTVWKREVAGIVTPNGHDFSHVAILARAMNIPMMVGFEGDVKSYMDRDVLLDEASEKLYLVGGSDANFLIPASHVDGANPSRVSREDIEKAVEKEVTGMPLRVIAKIHDELVRQSIRATEEGDFDDAVTLTLKAHAYHGELRKLQNRDQPFSVYAWEGLLPSSVAKKAGVVYSQELNLSEVKLSVIREALIRDAHRIDPAFKELQEIYGDRLRLEVTRSQHYGKYAEHALFRINAIVDGGDEFLMRKEVPTAGAGPFLSAFLNWIGRGVPKAVSRAREEAQSMVGRIPGARYVEYEIIDKYHDRGILRARTVIGVLPPLETTPEQ
ncbi:MAG: hypothetical protein HN337_06145 [Deltaproteobacteria bacterium]|nr:hypothetical protein [Deltaproteobacteria bacterium]